MKLKPKAYKFKTSTQWIQTRRGVLSAHNQSTIDVGCPPEFGGEPGYWTAEQLFVASIEVCIMTTFKWFLEKMGGELISYESEAIGIVQMVNGGFRFYKIEIKPTISASRIYVSKIKEAIENAHEECVISKTLNIKVDVNPVIKMV